MASQTTIRLPDRLQRQYSARVKTILYNAAAEGINTFLFILILAGARWLVEHLFGQAKFFDSMPVRYFFDAGDIAIILRFLLNSVKGVSRNGR